MFLLCCAQRPSYLFHIMFPSPNILKHYVEFDICTIVMLEKLISVISFGGFISHLVYHEATLFASLNNFNLHSVVQTIAPTFLGC
jgi:hypothetical protein